MAGSNFAPAIPARRALVWLLNHRDCHEHLAENAVQFELLFRDDTPSSRGKEVNYSVRIVRGRDSYRGRNLPTLTTADSKPIDGDAPREIRTGAGQPYVSLEFSLPWWQRIGKQKNGDLKRMAAIDKLLCQVHAGQGERSGVRLSLVAPDAVIFSENIACFGDWEGEIPDVPEQVGIPLEDLPPLDAVLSPDLAKQIMDAEGEAPAEQQADPDEQPAEMEDEAEGTLRQLVNASEPGTAEDAAEHQAARLLQDVAEEIQAPGDAACPPALASSGNGAANGGKRSRRKPAEEIKEPNPAGFEAHKAERRAANLAEGAGA